MNQNNSFILTKEYKKFSEFCRACHREKLIGLCYGPPGVGKSMSAHHFASWDKIEYELNHQEDGIDLGNIRTDMKDLNTILYVPTVYNTPKSIVTDIQKISMSFNLFKSYSIKLKDEWTLLRENNYVEIIIIDEADRLQPKALEAIRDIYDRGLSFYKNNPQIAVILIGMPGIEKRLIRFPQLYSRIGFVHSFKPLNESEVKFILQSQLQNLNIDLNPDDFSDQEAIGAITRITQGNFRLINRLLKQSLRVMQVNQLSSITKEVVEAARECLVIGNV